MVRRSHTQYTHISYRISPPSIQGVTLPIGAQLSRSCTESLHSGVLQRPPAGDFKNLQEIIDRVCLLNKSAVPET